jgi:hypothetical protein
MEKLNTTIKTFVVFGMSFLLFAACGKKDDGAPVEAAVPNPCVGATSNYYNNSYCVNGVPQPITGIQKQLNFNTLSNYASGALLVAMSGNGSLTGSNGYGTYNPSSGGALYNYYGPVGISGSVNFNANTCTNMPSPGAGSYSVQGNASGNGGTFTSMTFTAGPYVFTGRGIVYSGETQISLEGVLTVNGQFCGQISTY